MYECVYIHVYVSTAALLRPHDNFPTNVFRVIWNFSTSACSELAVCLCVHACVCVYLFRCTIMSNYLMLTHNLFLGNWTLQALCILSIQRKL